MINDVQVLPLSTSSEMVTFTLANGSVATLRASGTEPKIKYYVQLKTAPGKEQESVIVFMYSTWKNPFSSKMFSESYPSSLSKRTY